MATLKQIRKQIIEKDIKQIKKYAPDIYTTNYIPGTLTTKVESYTVWRAYGTGVIYTSHSQRDYMDQKIGEERRTTISFDIAQYSPELGEAYIQGCGDQILEHTHIRRTTEQTTWHKG